MNTGSKTNARENDNMPENNNETLHNCENCGHLEVEHDSDAGQCWNGEADGNKCECKNYAPDGTEIDNSQAQDNFGTKTESFVHTGTAIGWYHCDGKNCPICQQASVLEFAEFCENSGGFRIS